MSFVSEFIINPVLAQARRLSRAGSGNANNSNQAAAETARTAEAENRGTDTTAQQERQDGGRTAEVSEQIETLMRDASLEDVGRNRTSDASPMEGLTDRPMVASPPPLEEQQQYINAPVAQPLTVESNGAATHVRVTQAPMRLLTSRSLHTDLDMSDNPQSPFPTTDSPQLMSPVDTRSVYDGSPAFGVSAPTQQTSSALPEDDGMRTLRQKIVQIQKLDLAPEEKAKRMHELLTEGYTQSQISQQIKPASLPERPEPMNYTAQERPATPTSSTSFGFWHTSPGRGEAVAFQLTPEDLAPTYAPLPESDEMVLDGDNRALGCEHYKRNVKLQCATCKKWYTCRLCHDAVEDHVLPRKETRNMLCMLCGTAQKAGDQCGNCSARSANYYCDICHLWEDDPNRSIYHCNDCGICRVGRGLGKDFFHCKTCGLCMNISMLDTHRCIERSTDCNCPICFTYLFTSPQTVVFMRCGHTIHRHCYHLHMQTSYKCPICQQTVVNMETQFRRLDRAIQAQPMPMEFRMRVMVGCNDCRAKSVSDYHWLGLKCAVCDSYNTRQLAIITEDALQDRPAEGADASAVVSPGQETAPDGTSAEIPIPGARRRRHSSHARGQFLAPEGFDTYVSSRLGRSASPPRIGGYFSQETRDVPVANEREQEQFADNSLLDFWGRPLDAADVEAEGEDEETSEEEDSVMEDVEEDDDDDDEQDPLQLFGHR